MASSLDYMRGLKKLTVRKENDGRMSLNRFYNKEEEDEEDS